MFAIFVLIFVVWLSVWWHVNGDCKKKETMVLEIRKVAEIKLAIQNSLLVPIGTQNPSKHRSPTIHSLSLRHRNRHWPSTHSCASPQSGLEIQTLGSRALQPSQGYEVG